MRRWLVVVLGLAMAAAAAWAVVTWGPMGKGVRRGLAASEEPAGPHDDIDEASRRRMLEVLREEREP